MLTWLVVAVALEHPLLLRGTGEVGPCAVAPVAAEVSSSANANDRFRLWMRLPDDFACDALEARSGERVLGSDLRLERGGLVGLVADLSAEDAAEVADRFSIPVRVRTDPTGACP